MSIASARATARARVSATFHTQTVSLTRDGITYTAACHLATASGRIERGVEGRDQQRGAYTLFLPAGATLAPRLDEEVTVDTAPLQRFVVVWVPPTGNQSLARSYGLDEVR